MKLPSSLFAAFGLLVIVSSTVAPAVATDYAAQIKPVLQERCYACHGALKQEGGLRLDTAALAIQGGDSGAAIVPSDASASPLLDRVSAAEEADRMPPEGEPLKAAEIAALTAWIAAGAVAPANEQPERDPQEHWAFQTPQRPPVPTPGGDDIIILNPIDAFIAEARRRQGLQAQSATDKRVWLRRVSLDLVGLPPTPEELDAFLLDESDEAYDRVATRLLNSPRYGERWGRHWMDIWRYSDWWGLGAEVRNSQKHIWHWRDWIIESLNADKGYDQMLREMLAADELYPNDLDRLRATGFLARQYFKFNRTSWMDEAVEHTAKAMLGLTFNCAKCHDHKYDPISHVAYYQLRAIFEPYQVRMDAVPGETDFEKNGIPRAFDCNLDAPTYLHLRGDDRNPDTSRMIVPAVPDFLGRGRLKIEPVALPIEAARPELRPFVVESHLNLAEQRISQAKTALAKAQELLLASRQADAEAKKLAETKAADTKSAEPETPKANHLVRDDFSTAQPDVWEMREGDWNYLDGKLVQSQTGSSRTALRLKQLPPADFQATLKYVPTGGDMWKSVGLTFDVGEPSDVLAYLSSYAGGPKAQLAYRAGSGSYVYPANATQARAVELNKPHELTLRVRGPLVNITVDGEHAVAYRLPIARQRGHLEIITFDATAEFLSFELSELSADVMLVDAASTVEKPAAAMTREQAQLAVTIAERALKAAEAEPPSIRARATAHAARHAQPQAADLADLVQAAVQAERIAAAAKAEENEARAEADLLQAPPDKKDELQKKLTATRDAAEKARQAIDADGTDFTPLVGALKTLESNLENEQSRRKPFPETSSGRRRAFAEWLTDVEHPLPARVAVNHIWARHFGQPLVATVFDFGRKGAAPTHPELLDWLAVELIESGWSMKHLHRLIVTSHTYRLTASSAGVSEETRARDPDNKFYWRANPIRMEAQLVRDSLLHIAGELELTQGGPSIPVRDESSRRRSLYFVHSHNEHQKFLSIFDDANVLDCYRRAESIVPQQALALENSPLATSMAEKISRRLSDQSPTASDRDFIRAAFLAVLAVEPTAAEEALTMQALSDWIEMAKNNAGPDPAVRARALLVQALLNHNDFVTIR